MQTNVAFLEGLAAEELSEAEFDRVDPYFPALTGIRARKAPAAPSATRLDNRPRGLVLLYHRIDTETDVHTLNVPPARFDAQLSWLTSNTRVLTLEELLAAQPEDLPDRAVALTFDDGYTDNLATAAPAMSRAGVPATFFLTTRWLDAAGSYWWDLLECALLGSSDPPASLEIELGGERMRFPTGSGEERRRVHDAIHPHLVRASLIEQGSVDRSIAGVERVETATASPDAGRRSARAGGHSRNGNWSAHRQPSGPDVSI